jgi:hypothetical protein
METFCLTALEAAKTKTLVITNHLAALQNTVGDRGIIIEGDPTTSKWQNKALEIIKDVITTNKDYNEYIHRNYEWASNLTWKNQANNLLNNFILQNSLEYKNMFNWTNDLPSGTKQPFLNVIEYFKSKNNDKQIKILEIGTYTGISLINIVKCIPNSIGYGLDKWSNYNELNNSMNIENLQVEKSFYSNIARVNLQNRIFGIKSDSTSKLIEFIKIGAKFNFIYVDGSHLLLDCYSDLVLSWQILEEGGLFVIDDYLFEKNKILDSPFEAINHFLKVFDGQYKILHIDYRVFLQKD